MQALSTQYPFSQEKAALWKPKSQEGISLFKANFNKFVFKKHAHKEFAIGVIESGIQKFSHVGTQYIAAPKTIITVNPGEIHDGMSADKQGYRYRLFYLHPRKMNKIVKGLSGIKLNTGYFKVPVTMDDKIANKLLSAFLLLERDNNFLKSHTFFAQAIFDLFLRYGTQGSSTPRSVKDNEMVKKACEYIRSRVTENVTLKDIAGAVGLSQYHFLRIFKNTTGLPPHAFLINQRIELAKEAIDKGSSIINAATMSGFSDQSHMTRCFKSIYGIPPGQYKKSVNE